MKEEFRIAYGDWEWSYRLRFWDLYLGLALGIRVWELGLKIGVGVWDWGFGFEIGIWDWELGLRYLNLGIRYFWSGMQIGIVYLDRRLRLGIGWGLGIGLNKPITMYCLPLKHIVQQNPLQSQNAKRNNLGQVQLRLGEGIRCYCYRDKMDDMYKNYIMPIEI